MRTKPFRKIRRTFFFASALCLVLLVPLGVRSAQQPTSAQKLARQTKNSVTDDAASRRLVAGREPLARYVPIEASIYFRMSDHRKWLELLGSVEEPASIRGENVQSLLAGQPRVIALPSWRKRKEMITICAPNDAAAFATLLKTSAGEAFKQDDRVSVYHLPSGLWAATNGRVFILSDIGSGSAIFDQSVKMLSDPKRKSLLDDRRFREYMRRVKPSAAGVLFVDESWERRLGRAEPDPQARPAWLPDLESGCVEIHMEPERIVCRLTGTRRELHPPLAQALDAAQLKLLPASTIAAWTVPIEAASLIEFGTRYLPRNKPSFYRQLARTVETYDLTGLLPLSELGPRSAWCLLAGGERAGTLRWAGMIEAKQAASAVATLSQICRGVAGVINAHQATAVREVGVQTADYKGHRIHELTITRLDEERGSPLFGEFRPSMCALDNQIVFASEPSVIREIIDASQQSAYALPMLKRWAAENRNSSGRTQARGFADPKLMALELTRLQKALQTDDEELLQNEWFQSLRDYFNATPVRLGARLRKDNAQTPGKVYVMHVLEGRPSDGVLRPGDYITGIDGELLSLTNPTQDLKKKLRAKPGGGMRALRIERHGQVREVDIYLPKPSPKSLRGLMDDTGNAIGQLAALGAVVRRITYHQFGASSAQIDAEIVFELRAGSDKR